MLIDSVRERLRKTRTRAEPPSRQARSTVHKWINAQAVPRIDALVRFSETHGVSVVWLLTGYDGSTDENVDLENFRDRLSNSVCGHAREICEQTGITLAALNSWIAPSQKTLPKIDGLLAIARATNSSIRWLLTGQGPRTPFEGEREEPRSSEPTPFPRAEEVRAEDVPLGRFIAFLESVWSEPDAACWLKRELQFLEERFFERFPELEKKSTTQRSGNGAA